MGKRRKDEEIIEEVVAVDNTTDKSTAWFEKNKGLIMGLIGLAVLLVLALIVFKFFIKEPKEKAAKAAIYQAELRFAQDSFALALDNPGIEAEGFLDIIDNYGGTKTANLAKLYAGISYLNLGRFEDAISYLNSYNESGNVTSITKYGALGDAYSELGDVSKALSSYSKATSKDVGVLTPYYLHKLGILSYREGDNDQAAKAFNRLKSEFPSAPEAEDASKYLGMLN